MDGEAVAGEVEALPDVLRKIEHATEVGRDPLRGGDPLVVNDPERQFRLEPAHYDGRGSDPVLSRREDERRRVVEGRRREVPVRGVEPEDGRETQDREDSGRVARRLPRQGLAHPLREAGRTRGVEHQGPLERVV